MSRSNTRALLIGCDFYFDGHVNSRNGNPITYHSLYGAVRDVVNVKKFLLRNGVPEKNIVSLTASHNGHSRVRPAEDPAKWPTHANIVQQLKIITETSAPGSLVYIHFSGHGQIRGKLDTKNISSGGDPLHGAALVTTDALLPTGRFLTAYELGLRLQAMVGRHLRVTLVLHACYSGGGLRRHESDFTVRTSSDALPDFSREHDVECTARADVQGWLGDGTRQGIIREDWLSNPRGCTVITACGINQEAGEREFQDPDSGKWSKEGVLTHWMLDCLTHCGTPSFPSYAAIKEFVKEKIVDTLEREQQVPVVYGDAEYEFVGTKKHVKRPASRVIDTWEDRVSLETGRAQGCAVGAIYDIYPRNLDVEDPRSFKCALEARIVKVDDLSSVAILTRSPTNEVSSRSMVERGSKAVLRTWALRTRMSVEFVTDEARLNSALKSELEMTSNLALHEGFGNGTFEIRTDSKGHFDIFEHDPNGNSRVKLRTLPVIAVNSELAIPKLAHVIRHISRFRDIERLDQLSKPPRIGEDKFEVMYWRGSEKLEYQMIDGVKRLDVIQGEELTWRLLYRGPAEYVYAVMFELDSTSWKVERRCAVKLIKDSVEPSQYRKGHWYKSSITQKSRHIDDRMMVFLAEGEDEISWDEIELDSLSINAQNLQIDVRAKSKDGGQRRGEWQLSREPPCRNWGITSYVIRSSPGDGRH